MAGFVYIWYDRKHKRYYIGSHWGTENDGYICSSNWMKQAYKRRPGDFKRRILSKVETTRSDLLVEEQRWLNMMRDDEMKGSRYYNMIKRTNHLWHAQGDEKLKTVGEKISAAHRGRKLSIEHRQAISEAGKGRKLSAEAKAKMSAAKRGLKRSTEHCQAISDANRGRKHTAEARANMAKAQTGRKHSEETKTKMSEAMRGRKFSAEHCQAISEAKMRQKQVLV